MKYTEYPGEKTYVVFHTEGTGEQGGAPVEKEKLESFDTMEEALAFGNQRYPRVTGWEWDGFTININTLTEKGKEELKKLKEQHAIVQKDMKENPHLYKTIESDGLTITFKYNPIFDGPKVTPEEFYRSARVVYFDPDKE